MAEPITPTRVQFSEELSEPSKPRPKQPPTQRYDRSEIQKRLDIESWMDEQLRDLYECDVSQRERMEILRVLLCVCVCTRVRARCRHGRRCVSDERPQFWRYVGSVW